MQPEEIGIGSLINAQAMAMTVPPTRQRKPKIDWPEAESESMLVQANYFHSGKKEY
jgi:hypothetical protein